MFLIATLLASLAWATDVGLGTGLVGWSTSARHRLMPPAALWVTDESDRWAWSAEALWAYTRDTSPLYEFDTHYVRLSGTVDAAFGSQATSFRVGAGPALSMRAGRATEILPGVRTRVALHGPLGERVAWMWSTGATVRPRGVDYDLALGLGVRL